jgi:hypothetical protein
MSSKTKNSAGRILNDMSVGSQISKVIQSFNELALYNEFPGEIDRKN